MPRRSAQCGGREQRALFAFENDRRLCARAAVYKKQRARFLIVAGQVRRQFPLHARAVPVRLPHVFIPPVARPIVQAPHNMLHFAGQRMAIFIHRHRQRRARKKIGRQQPPPFRLRHGVRAHGVQLGGGRQPPLRSRRRRRRRIPAHRRRVSRAPALGNGQPDVGIAFRQRRPLRHAARLHKICRGVTINAARLAVVALLHRVHVKVGRRFRIRAAPTLVRADIETCGAPLRRIARQRHAVLGQVFFQQPFLGGKAELRLFRNVH